MGKEILRVLAYSDIFDFPLTFEEIEERIIKKIPGLNKQLNILLKEKCCQKKGDFYFLPGREDLVTKRQNRERFSIYKRQKAEKVSSLLSLIPWVKLIGITGGVASNNALEDDDIDLFFIVDPGRLWLTRGLIVFFLWLLGIYRRPNKIKDRICPNMYVVSDHLEVAPRDIYIAYEIYLMKPLLNREDIYLRFLKANQWAEKFLPIMREKGNPDSIDKRKKFCNTSSLVSKMLRIVENLAKRLQIKYMSKRRTTETVNDSVIKFHPGNIHEEILRRYRLILIKNNLL